MKRFPFLFITSTLVIACDFFKSDNSINEKFNVGYLMKLPSADKKSNLYTYYIKAENAEYGSTWFTILSSMEKFKPFGDHLTLGNSIGGFNILGWSKDTIKATCIMTDTQPKDLQPFRREVKKWQEWYVDVSYYYANSFGATTPLYFDTMKIEEDTIKFLGSRTVTGIRERYEIAALKGQVQIPSGDTIIRVNKPETDMNFVRLDETGKTLTKQPQVSIGSYELRPSKKVDWTRLKECGVFVEQQLN